METGIDIQDLDAVHEGRGVYSSRRLPVHQVLERWSIKDGSRHPINLLNLGNERDGVMPWPLVKRCGVLSKAVANVSRSLKELFIDKEEVETVAGAVDIQSYTRFQILGQAGRHFGLDYGAVNNFGRCCIPDG
jgi:hypothetical protein